MKKEIQDKINYDMRHYRKMSPPARCTTFDGKQRLCYYFDPKQGDVFSKSGILFGVIGCDVDFNPPIN